jgi:DNA (cytosine-5)-methyltransferase 1
MSVKRRLTAVPPGHSDLPQVAEFFAGIGLVRMGLESAGFEVSWSNDIEADKRDMYVRHFDDGAQPRKHEFYLDDIGAVSASDLPADLALAWASFPCTDLSLAGSRAGLAGKSSGTFWQFTRIIGELPPAKRPPVVALENVVGLATSHGGDDLAAAVRELNELGYSVDVLTLDARRFVPQSRPRLFLVGALDPPDDSPEPNSELRPDWLQAVYGDTTLRTHRAALPAPPAPLTKGLGASVERLRRTDDRWWGLERASAFVDSLSDIQAARTELLRKGKRISYRTAYRRTRNGVAVWEVRPDDIAGCLRTARGGSSKQAVVKLGKGRLQVRWMTSVEYARLMGAGEYRLDGIRTNQALFGFGDAVCVPVVAWLAENYLGPLVEGRMASRSQARVSLSV